MWAIPSPTASPAPSSVTTRQPNAVLLGVVGIALWFLVVYLGRTWGLLLDLQGRRIELFTPPILGGYRVAVDGRFAIPVVAAIVLIALLPWLLDRVSWRMAIVLTVLGALIWWVSLALIDGPLELVEGLNWPADFEGFQPAINDDPFGFLRGFTDSIKTYPIQIRGHPPGLPLLLAAMAKVGLGGVNAAAAATLAGAVAALVAILVAIRELADEDTARRAMPFLAIAPAATWIVISFDAMFAGFAAWFVTTLLLASRRTGRRAVTLAIVSGALAFITIMMSYGLGLMGLVAIGFLVAQRNWRAPLIASATAAALVLILVPLGFWLGTGLGATVEEYHVLGLDRPYSYFVVNNMAAWALVVGPATFAGLLRLRDRRLWMLVGGGFAAIVAANISGLSAGEVERIWLPFSLWVLPAAAVLATTRLATRFWMAVQAASGIVLAMFINVYW